MYVKMTLKHEKTLQEIRYRIHARALKNCYDCAELWISYLQELELQKSDQVLTTYEQA